ncbi:uncharacterized protein LOC117103434 [Anneissia japonica]|uniref:uncharacterized protein LOC117103434 n=1 Tax=Anneissia japonica TaxID=1529436 RepID=UPI001425BA1F|nr:uncharacterized protein LOC117103434 [Anneissia japonica]
MEDDESHMTGEFDTVDAETGFWDKTSLAAENKGEANNLRDGVSLAVGNGIENAVNLKNETGLNYEADLADISMEDPANNLRDGVGLAVGMENEANLQNKTGMNDEADLAADNSEDESSAEIESGMDNEAQRTALSLRSSMGDAYLDGPSTDPETLDDFGLLQRPFSYITENFNQEPEVC